MEQCYLIVVEEHFGPSRGTQGTVGAQLENLQLCDFRNGVVSCDMGVGLLCKPVLTSPCTHTHPQD